MLQEISETKLNADLQGLVFWKQLVFLVIVCQRLYPSVKVFAADEDLADDVLLESLIHKAWNSLLDGKSEVDFSKEIREAESQAPNTENFDSTFVSSALDASVAISLLMKAFGNQQTNTIVEAVALARDSIEMYVQEIENMDSEDPDLERKILAHDLMQTELKRQREDLELLNSLNDDISKSMKDLKSKYFASDASSLGLT